MSVIAFLDEDAGYVADSYIFEFSKITLYQNGYLALDLSEIQEGIEKIVSIKYTLEEIQQSFDRCDPNEKQIQRIQVVETNEIKYSLSSEAETELRKRNKHFLIWD